MFDRLRLSRRYPLLRRRHVWAALLAPPIFIVGAIFFSNYYTLLKYEIGISRCDCPQNTELRRRPLFATMTGLVFDSAVMSVNALRAAFDQETPPQKSELESVHLRVKRNSLKELAGDLPESAKSAYRRAWLRYPDGKWRAIRYRFRGRNIWHWMPEKPSLRLKVSRQRPIDLQRHINLVNPEDRMMVANPLGERLASELGVLTHRTRPVRLFINNVYFGVYHWSTREDESLLRAQSRIPGPIYIGDRLRERWVAEDFERAGDVSSLSHIDPIRNLVSAIYLAPGSQRQTALWRILSFEKFARYVAVSNLVGSTHTDYHHNNLFYFDPAAGRIEPVISDINGHGMLDSAPTAAHEWRPNEPDHTKPINEKITPLLDAALRNPKFYHRRNQILHEALNGIGSAQSQERLLEAYFRKMAPDILADRRKAALQLTHAGYFRVPYSNNQFIESKDTLSRWIERRNRFLESTLSNATVRATVATKPENGLLHLVVEVDGNAAAVFDPNAVPGAISADRKFTGSPLQRVGGPILLYPGLTEDRAFNHPLTAVFRSPKHYLRPAGQRYLFGIKPRPGIDFESVRSKLLGAFKHALTGQPLIPAIESVPKIDGRAVKYNTVSVHAWRLGEEATGTKVLGPGIVDLKQDLVISSRQTLKIVAGTTVRLGAGVSIISRGHVALLGTAERPIVLKRRDKAAPWGSFVVQGAQSRGSRIEHARISGGSLATRFNVKYSGMVSVHWSPDFVLADSIIEGNILSDDTLHVVHGNMELRRTLVRNCFADCIDLDYVKATVEDLKLLRAGNDGIDFMASQATLSRIEIDQAEDKGISAGEGSLLTVGTLSIKNANIGIAAKDTSRVVVSDADFADNTIALSSFAKNWRYGAPGTMTVKRTRFVGNDVNLQAVDGATVEFIDQPVPAKVAGGGRVTTQLSEKP